MPGAMITFPDRTFCFTGKLSDLKRTAAEREVRASGGLTIDRINDRLDDLVVGEEASPPPGSTATTAARSNRRARWCAAGPAGHFS
jgi:NAD-dependent DNA ligase